MAAFAAAATCGRVACGRATACACAGVAADARSLRSRWLSDWSDGWCHPRALSAGVFAFFAQAAPAVTFGGLLAARTGGALGVWQTLLAMGGVGALAAAGAGQPLVLLGTTGPVVLLLAALADAAAALGVDFLAALAATCLWAAAAHAALAAGGAPRALVARVTPCSADIFGALVCATYVVLGATQLAALDAAPAGALSVGLGIGCAAAAVALTNARRWPCAGACARARSVLADYGLALAVVAVSALQFAPAFASQSAALPRLPAPAGALALSGAAALRALPPWAAAAAALPGGVLTGLLYFDHQISAMLTQEPRFRLRKPPSYDLDFLLLGAALALTGVLGLPPVYGLLPQAPLHVRALADIAPGPGGGEVWRDVVETRWSALLQAALLLLLLAPPLLALLAALPLGVLAGMLLFIGGAGLTSNGIVRRARSLFAGEQPHGASRAAAAAFTAMQLAAVAAIYGIMASPAALAFPLAILLLVPLRNHALPHCFGAHAVDALDPPDWGRASEEVKVAAAAAAAVATAPLPPTTVTMAAAGSGGRASASRSTRVQRALARFVAPAAEPQQLHPLRLQEQQRRGISSAADSLTSVAPPSAWAPVAVASAARGRLPSPSHGNASWRKQGMI